VKSGRHEKFKIILFEQQQDSSYAGTIFLKVISRDVRPKIAGGEARQTKEEKKNGRINS
jgi:hypothetical protein